MAAGCGTVRALLLPAVGIYVGRVGVEVYVCVGAWVAMGDGWGPLPPAVDRIELN